MTCDEGRQRAIQKLDTDKTPGTRTLDGKRKASRRSFATTVHEWSSRRKLTGR
uniref:Uncharacterized protein n=1 Tax=Cucumis melo TaxID=3656 RepID=A0A9I9DMC1_CUCME